MELLPCPFCGGTDTDPSFAMGAGHQNAGCMTCAACGPSAQSDDEAVKLWNRRVSHGNGPADLEQRVAGSN